MEYYIYITNKCNMNCSYCSVMMNSKKSNLPESIDYSLDDLESFIDNTQSNHIDEDAIIYFFGGEPTLDYKKISEIINIFKVKKGYKVKFVLHTNGILLGAIPYNIISNIDIIFLSLNYERVLVNNRFSPYFYNTVNAITDIKSKFKIITIGRFTISSKTNLYLEATMSSLFFDYIYWQLDNQKIIDNIEEYKKDYMKEVKLLLEHWIEFIEKGILLRYIPFLSITKNTLNSKAISVPTHYYCGYGDDIIYIQTDGSCFGCCDNIDEGSHFIGSIYNGIQFKNMDITEHCRACRYIKICGGRCGRMHEDFDLNRINSFCEMNIFLFELLQKEQTRIKKAIQNYPELKNAFNDINIEYTEQIP